MELSTLLPFPAYWLSTLVPPLLLTLYWLRRQRHRRSQPYRLQSPYLSQAQLRLMAALRPVLKDDQLLLARVPLDQLVKADKALPEKAQRRATARLGRLELDLLLLDATAKPLAAICLEGQGDREFIGRCLAALELPLISFPDKQQYQADGLRRRLKAALNPHPELPHFAALRNDPGPGLNDGLTALVPAADEEIEVPVLAEKICARCGDTMNRRIAQKGKLQGRAFWACNRYPHCRHLELETLPKSA
ncbi:DUF2726 domain-containing protein [Gallaecimonas sp. GXIMD4217]|uniref:DUF2726 domain-containing protein n=1 Tax=Gallaecimonas sp. GXIMD4217 TaxID=3131927 RepID=UPI00311ABA1C